MARVNTDILGSSELKWTGMGCHIHLQGIFPTQALNLGLLCFLHCKQSLYPLSHLGSPENPMNSMKRQNDRILKEELPRSVGPQHATGVQWRNNSRKNEGMEPKQKQYPVVDVTGHRSKVQCCKEQYCIRTWNVRSMNQGQLEVVK